jgi:hypothetical protein
MNIRARLAQLSRWINDKWLRGQQGESLSGRAWRLRDERLAWAQLRIWIDLVFVVLGEPGHCRRTHEDERAAIGG